MARSKRRFRGGGTGQKKKRRKISLEKLSKLNKERIEREKMRYAKKEETKEYKTSGPSTASEELSSSDEEDQQTMTPYQELLANLGADVAEDDDLSDEEDSESEIEGEEGTIGEDGVNDDEVVDDSDIEDDDSNIDIEDEEDNDEEIGEVQAGENGLSGGEGDGDSNGRDEGEEEEVEVEIEDLAELASSSELDDDDDDDDGSDDGKDDNQGQVHKDPFYKRINYELSEDVISKFGKGRPCNIFEEKWPRLGKLSCSCFDDVSRDEMQICKETDFKSLHVPKRVSSSWKEANKDYIEAGSEANLSRLQQELFSIMNSYKDLVYPERNYQNEEEIRLVYCLHVLSYIVKSRNVVLKHNQMLTANPDLDTESMRDRGLTRPRVLILVPFRSSALEVIKTMAKILVPTNQSMSHRKRFFDEYGLAEERRPSKFPKPEDWEALFKGNYDDHFRMGVTITRKSFKLYSTFYSADIIIASPLGLRTVIGAKGENHHEYDFLSSIELLVMDQTDVFLMQNWEHITHIMDHLHLQPKDSHDVDFSRVRMWALNKWNKYYRQTLIFSNINTPEINALASKHCSNMAGRVLVNNVPSLGSIGQVAVQLPQVFHKLECDSYASSHEKRFQFFISKILPQYRESLMSGTMIYIPSYFDFVRVRNYFRKQEINFAQICEYTSQANMSRARHYMREGTRHTLIVTERLHFFRRFKYHGIHHIIFYQLPTYPHYYSELCNMLETPTTEGAMKEHTCSVLYTKYDALRLGPVVGLKRNTQMLNSEKNVHMFVSEDV
ncbi:digestive organ expansion factor homolog [Lytechinus variegatus]|uniref:digestive organ expansion factor homolog n=1 Tax=Lytechinus variegatus TaxID=7654 RepID=UPI001BB1670A|nr:digestive organ expansion factor homolog [Lytechinus variegatus]